MTSKADGLQFVEALLKSADGSVSLTIHPRCKRLITVLLCYTRAKRAGQWQDYPENPLHPHEDLVDPLCGGLKLEFPEGRTPPPNFRRGQSRDLLLECPALDGRLNKPVQRRRCFVGSMALRRFSRPSGPLRSIRPKPS